MVKDVNASYSAFMKVFLLVFFALAAVLNAPMPCAHALGLGDVVVQEADGHEHMHHEHADHEHAHHGHSGHDARHGGGASPMDHAGHANDTAHTDRHDGCAEGCEGGAGCGGCVIAAGAIGADPSLAGPEPVPAHRHFANRAAESAVTGAEPPPPRA